MKKIIVLSALLFSGCTASPEQLVKQYFAHAEKITVQQKKMERPCYNCTYC